VEKTPNDIYRDVSEGTDLSSDDVAAIGGLESQHGKFDKPLAGGSARGLFQFQPDTAEYLEEGSSDSLHDLDTQAKLMKLYLEKNKVSNAEDAFAKHNLGSSRGDKFINAPDDALVTDVIPFRVIRANPSIYNVKTIGEARQRIREKLDKGRESSDIRPNFLDLFKGKE
jgi:hypothetical protein